MVREGLFSPGEKDETGEELPFNHHIIQTMLMHIICVSVRLHVFLNMMLHISHEMEHFIFSPHFALCAANHFNF